MKHLNDDILEDENSGSAIVASDWPTTDPPPPPHYTYMYSWWNVLRVWSMG